MKIEGLTDESDRATGTLFLRNIEADKLKTLLAALIDLGIPEITKNIKVDSRLGGILLWDGGVQRDFNASGEYKEQFWVQVWKYPAMDNQEEIGVLFIKPFDNELEKDKGDLYINLNGVQFTRGSIEECHVRLENFSVVQRVRDGKVSDEPLTELNWTVVGHKTTKREDKLNKLCDGPEGSVALYAALSKAGAYEIIRN